MKPWKRKRRPSFHTGSRPLKACAQTFLSFLLLLLAGSSASIAQSPSQKLRDDRPVSRFGKESLVDVELIAEVTVVRIYRMGLGVDVVKIKLDQVILNRLPPKLSKQPEPLMLAHHGQYTADTRLLLFLKRCRNSERLVSLHRISHLDINYKEKIRMIREYVRIENIPNRKARVEALVKTALEYLKDDSYWIRCNCAKELDDLVKSGEWRFTRGDVAYLENIEKEAEKPVCKRLIAAVREKMASGAEEGPPFIKEKADEKKERSGKGSEGG